MYLHCADPLCGLARLELRQVVFAHIEVVMKVPAKLKAHLPSTDVVLTSERVASEVVIGPYAAVVASLIVGASLVAMSVKGLSPPCRPAGKSSIV